ncbi:cystatin [Diretmus argenteus]
MARNFGALAVVLLAFLLRAGAETHEGTAEIQAANFAIGFRNRLNNYPYAYKVLAILSDTAQIYPPARVKFTMTVKVGQTVCRNEPSVDLDSCRFQDHEHLKTMTCDFVVLAVPNSQVPSYLLENHCS